ncbi:MFS transporter [Pleomorphochaeta sp. DL1XJH-081]|uniref:MFS transporter n=1 Tax=Pleomorphochaeta sp. DL1XJH-081 TaxID=3409690 RepID=UPI003BB7B119
MEHKGRPLQPMPRVLILISSLSMFIMGFSDVLKGSAVAEMVSSLQVDYALGGIILGITYFGFFVGTLATVPLLKKIPVAKMLSASVVITALGVLLFGFASSSILIIFATFLTGMGCGLIDVSANLSTRIAASPDRVGRELNQVAFFHGVGAILAPLFATMVLGYFTSWQYIYRLAAIVLVVSVFIVTRGVSRSGLDDRVVYEPNQKFVWTWQFVVLGGFLFWYMTLEAGISGWLIAYVRQEAALSEKLSNTYLSLFFIMLTIGRFLSSRYVDRIGLLKTIIIHVLAVLIMVSLPLLFVQAHFLLPLSGLFMAPLFPTTVALLVDDLGMVGLRTTGAFFSIAGLGGLVGPWLIGYISREVSLRIGFGILPLFALAFIVLTIIYLLQKRRKVAI